MSFASCAMFKLLLHDGAAWLRGLSDTKRKESMKIEDEATYGPGNLRPNDIEWDPDALTSADWVTDRKSVGLENEKTRKEKKKERKKPSPPTDQATCAPMTLSGIPMRSRPRIGSPQPRPAKVRAKLAFLTSQ